MHNVSQNFLNTVKQPGRYFKAKVKVSDFVFEDESVTDLSLEENVNPSDSFMLGAVSSNKLDITLCNIPPTFVFENATLNVSLSMLVGSIYEDVPLGVFTVDEIFKDKTTVKLTCFDNMIKLEKAYFSDLTYPASINSVAQEICYKAGVQLANTLPDIQINKIEGYTYREAIGFIASFLGGFARFNRLGMLEITSYSAVPVEITGDNYFKLNTAEKELSIGRLLCKAGDSLLTAGSSGNEIQFENPIMTQAQLNNIFNTLKALSYMPYSMDWSGNHALQAGDKITIIDVSGNTYSTLLMRQRLNYKGGLTATAEAVGKTEQAQEFNSSGSLTNKVERILIEQIMINEALINRATVEQLIAVDARIDTLHGDFASFQTVTTNKLTAVDGQFERILSNESIAELLISGRILAGSTIIAQGAIGSAQISDLDVAKLNGGDISTAKFRVIGTNGRLKIENNLFQIFDGTTTLFERVALGDVNKNGSVYGLRIRGKDGTTILFDENGQTKEGFTDGYTKLDSNSLDPAKINIEKVVTRINEGTTTINSAKIKLDDKTLDVKFTAISDTVSGHTQSLTTQGSQIAAVQSSITNKVWQTDITKAVGDIRVGGRNLLSLIDFAKNLYTNGQNAALKSWKFIGKPNMPYTLSTNIPRRENTRDLFFGVYPSTPSSTVNGVALDEPRTIVSDETGVIEVTIRSQSWADSVIAGRYWVKLEFGNKATDWTPALEDVEAQFEAIDTGKADRADVSNLWTSMTHAETAINQLADNLSLYARKTEINTLMATIAGMGTSIDLNTSMLALKADQQDVDYLSGVVNSQSAQISLLSNRITLDFTRLNQELEDATTDLVEMRSYFDFSADYLKVGKSNSPFNITISDQQMDFLDSGSVVAYINGQKYYITNGHILQSLTVGVHVIEKYNNDISFVKWVGGN